MENQNANANNPEQEKKLLRMKAKTPLERAQERLRTTRLDETAGFSAPEPAAPGPAPQQKPAAPPSQEVPSAKDVQKELEQALEQKPSLKEALEGTEPKPAPAPAPEKPEAPAPEQGEKMKFLKREEIKTMQKDVKRTRESEAQQERQRIVGLQEKKKPQAAAPGAPQAPKGPGAPEEILIPQTPKRPSPLKKLFVRIFAFIGVALLASFAYWYFTQPKTIVEEQGPEEETPEEMPAEEEIVVPDALIKVSNTLTFDASSASDVLSLYAQIIGGSLSQDEFTRIVITNEQDNRLLTLDEIGQAFQLSIPLAVSQNLENETLLVYPQEEGKRGGIIAEIKDQQSLDSALSSWESDIIGNGLNVSATTVPALATQFKNYAFDSVAFRFLTLSKQDLGLCYGTYDNYFFLTTSFGSMEALIKALKEQIALNELKLKASQMLIVGFEGKTLTPELEQFFKKYRPGGVLLLSRNIESSEQLKILLSNLQNLSQSETGLPLFVAVDQEGGDVSRIGFLEEKTSQSAISNTGDAYTVGLTRAKELKELGVNLNLAPVLDNALSSDFVYSRTFQKAPETSGDLAKSLVSGQRSGGVLSAIKHFPGYVSISFNPEEQLATVAAPATSQFAKAMETAPEMVMLSNAVYSDIDSSNPLAFSAAGLNFVKNTLGFQVLTVSDDLSQNSLLDNFTLKEIMTGPAKAGVDLLIYSGWRSSLSEGLDEFLKAVESGEISSTVINNAYSRISALKQSLTQ